MKKVNQKEGTSKAIHRPIAKGAHMPDEACEPVPLPIHSHEFHTSKTKKEESCDSLRDRKLRPDHIILQEPEPASLPLHNHKVHTSKAQEEENCDGLRDRKRQPELIVFQEDETSMVLDENRRPIPLVEHVDGPHLQDSQETSELNNSNNDDNEVVPSQSTEPEVTITAYKVNNQDIENQVNQAVQERLDEAPVAQIVKTPRWKMFARSLILFAVLAAAITTSVVIFGKKNDTSDDPVYCSLCYSYREPQTNASESIFSQGVTCEAMEATLEKAYTKDDPSCLLHQTLAFTKCSCPELPPPSSNSNSTCSLCPDGSLPTNPDSIAFSDYTKQATNDDPIRFNSTDPGIVPMTCSALNTYLSYVSHPDLESTFGECKDYQLRDAIHCGCEDVVDGCLTSIAAYNFAEYALTDDRENRYYIMCPNTTYITDTVLDNGTIVHPWYDRFYIFYSNVHLKCGTDGSSSNNCTIRGGGSHLYMYFYVSEVMGLDPEREFKNVSVEGFTFTHNISNDGLAHSVAVIAFGDITIHDCVFVDNDIRYDEAIMAMAPDYFQTITDSSGLLVKIDECTFRNNVIGREEVGDNTIRPSGLIGNTDAEVQVTKSLFQNNTNAAIPPTKDRHAYLVRNTAGVLILIGNCFINNSVTIAPIVNELFGEVRHSRFNYVHIDHEGPPENVSGCDFIAHFDTGHVTGYNPIETLSYNCTNHEIDYCSLTACPILDCVRWLQVFDEIESYFGNGTLNDNKSPQFKAAIWIAGEDDALALDSMNDEIRMRLIQRYALAVLFYSTGGETDWISQNNFLSSDHECDWHMDVTPEPGTEVFFSISANGRPSDDFGDEYKNGIMRCAYVGQLGQLVTEVQMVNNNMKGQIPSEMFIGLPELKLLNFAKNDLQGTIPEEMYDMSKLSVVWLASNSLAGSISPLVKHLSKTLHNFWVGFNELTGTIPTEIGHLTLLLNFWSGRNMLRGSIPQEVSEMTNLELFDVQNSSLTGWVPTSFSNLSRLQVLDLGYNAIGGSIPDDFGFSLPSLINLELHHTGISGSIPSSIGSLSRLRLLRLNHNQLTGLIDPIINLSSAQGITLEYNNFNGTIPKALGGISDLQYLRMSGNQLTGQIPSSLGSLNKLVELDLNSNHLTSPIPESLGNLKQLIYLFLQKNNLTGPIPESLGNLNHLISLFLDSNNLSGTLPSSLGKLQGLSYLSLYNNNLEGSIPTSLSALSSFVYLFLEGNSFIGSVDFLCNSSFSAEGALWSADCFGEINCSCCGYCCNSANNCSYL